MRRIGREATRKFLVFFREAGLDFRAAYQAGTPNEMNRSFYALVRSTAGFWDRAATDPDRDEEQRVKAEAEAENGRILLGLLEELGMEG